LIDTCLLRLSRDSYRKAVNGISDNFQISYLTEFTFDELRFQDKRPNSTVSDVMKANAVIQQRRVSRGTTENSADDITRPNFIMFAPACAFDHAWI
jgi:hypothetical protein